MPDKITSIPARLPETCHLLNDKSSLPASHPPSADFPSASLPFSAAKNAVCHLIDDKPHRADAILELVVRNHPGTMSHITGLFARRAFNLEAILVVPLPGGETSRILLLVDDGPRLGQIERQLEKLHDVISVRLRPDLGKTIFAQLEKSFP